METYKMLKITMIILITCVVLLVLLIAYWVPYYRIRRLEKSLKKIKKVVNYLIANEKLFHTLSEAASKVEGISKMIFEEYGEGATLMSVFKEHIKEILFKFQDKLLEIERLSDFEPRIWWPKKYTERLAGIKKEVRSLLSYLRQN